MKFADHRGTGREGVPTRRKTAVLSMDVEDWYHLAYFDRTRCDERISLLDGLDVFNRVLDEEGIAGTYFVLGELAGGLRETLCEMAEKGHEIASHGWAHTRPMLLDERAFEADIRRAKTELERVVGRPVLGYRAPCFSLDRKRLDLVAEGGFAYDSSRILFSDHPLYGRLDLGGFSEISPNIFRCDRFCEFQVSTLRIGSKHVPVSGGGYLRIFPWWLMRRWIAQYVAANELYVLYIHPFELSQRPLPATPSGTSTLTKFRFGYGRREVAAKLRRLIRFLRDRGFEFTTFARLYAQQEGTGA